MVILAELRGKNMTINDSRELERIAALNTCRSGIKALESMYNDRNGWKRRKIFYLGEKLSLLEKAIQNHDGRTWKAFERFKKPRTNVNPPDGVYQEAFYAAAAYFAKEKRPEYIHRLKEVFPESYELAAVTIDKEILRMEAVSANTMSSLNGGGVGRLMFRDGSSNYIFKIEKDRLSAEKSGAMPHLVHQLAGQGDDLASRLARRMPKSLTITPIEKNRYYITISEDISNKMVVADAEDIEVMSPELERELCSGIINKLYVLALYHEVGAKLISKGSNAIIAQAGNEMQFLQSDVITDRYLRANGKFADRLHKVREILPKYDDNVAELRGTIPISKGNTAVHWDTKKDNWLNGYLLDYGLTRIGNEAEDLARLLMEEPIAIKQANRYVDAYIYMRKRINVEYEPDRPRMQELTKKLIGVDALRFSSWWALQNQAAKFNRAYQSTQICFN